MLENRNLVVFEDYVGCHMRVSAGIISLFMDWHKHKKVKSCRYLLQPSSTMGWPIGFFDGVEQDGICGTGFLIK